MHHGVAEIETSKLDLLWMIGVQFIKKPVVQGAIILKFQRANRMCDPFNGIRKAMSEVVHRINAPLVARPVMCCPQNAVHDRISHTQIRRCHINFRSQYAGTVIKFASPHALEQAQVLFDRTVTIRAVLTRLGQGATILSDLICAQVANVRLALFDQLQGVLIELLKVV